MKKHRMRKLLKHIGKMKPNKQRYVLKALSEQYNPEWAGNHGGRVKVVKMLVDTAEGL